MASEYGGFDEIDDKISSPLNKLNINKPKSDEIIQIDLYDDRYYASFKGASILGSLPSFKKFLVDKSTFDANPDSVKVDFEKIINQ